MKTKLTKSQPPSSPAPRQTAQHAIFEKLAVPSLTDVSFIDLAEVSYLESFRNYTTIYLDNTQKITSSKNLGYYEDLLSTHGFLRIHNSFMVNLSKIKRYIKGKTGYVELNNGLTVEVSVRRKEELFSFMALA